MDKIDEFLNLLERRKNYYYKCVRDVIDDSEEALKKIKGFEYFYRYLIKGE